MKKLLFGLLTIFGIGLSFCSAEIFNIYSRDFFNIYYDGGSSSFWDNGATNYPVSNYSSFHFSGYSSDLFLETLCFETSWHNDPKSMTLFGNVYTNYFYSGFYYCRSGLHINLKDYNYTISNYSFGINSALNSNMRYRDLRCQTNYYLLYNGNKIFLPYLSCYSNTCGYVQIFAYITLFIPDNPKFKINYGNTSYEYELEDNLSIYLKSPVVQSGDIFTYDGPTGINLFYNDTFQFYSKDKLYLKSMYWYNKNIFTPICL